MTTGPDDTVLLSAYLSVVELECENSAWIGESMVPHEPYLDSIPRQGLHVLDTA